ncbi:MAG: glycosyltransferase family 4 protein [Candidatus Sumerlaeota bacterium]
MIASSNSPKNPPTDRDAMAPSVLQLCAVDFTLDKFLAPLCFRLQQEGFEVTAACTESVHMQPLREKGLRCVDLPISRSMNLRDHWRSYRRLSKWLKEERFDIVHVHTPIAALIGRLAAARRHVPVRLYTAHGFYFHDDMPRRKRAFHIALERFGAFFHHYLFTQSDEDRQAALRLGLAKPGRVRTIGNGVDMERFNPERFSAADRHRLRRSLGLEDDQTVVTIIARLVREKGYLELFPAFAELAKERPELRLMVIGGALESDHDDSSAQIDAMVGDLGIRDRIVFAGQRADIPELLHASDIYTLPSWREGMPRSIIEAMAMGLPVVATNIRGCREEVVDGATGLLAPPRDPERLARKLAQLINDENLRRGYGRAGRNRACELYDEEKVFQRQLEVYRRLLSEAGIRQ